MDRSSAGENRNRITWRHVAQIKIGDFVYDSIGCELSEEESSRFRIYQECFRNIFSFRFFKHLEDGGSEGDYLNSSWYLIAEMECKTLSCFFYDLTFFLNRDVFNENGVFVSSQENIKKISFFDLRCINATSYVDDKNEKVAPQYFWGKSLEYKNATLSFLSKRIQMIDCLEVFKVSVDFILADVFFNSLFNYRNSLFCYNLTGFFNLWQRITKRKIILELKDDFLKKGALMSVFAQPLHGIKDDCMDLVFICDFLKNIDFKKLGYSEEIFPYLESLNSFCGGKFFLV